jgi:UDP-N-acetylglucosamine 2-epimerase (non-hydrolysing)
MKILIVVGARPNFMKAAPILAAVEQYNQTLFNRERDGQAEPLEPVLVHTGQHYDAAMSDAFFRDLGLPQPHIHLGVGSGSHAALTAEIMKKFEPVLLEQRPDVVIVVGDVNSTVACALVTSKISFDTAGSRPLVAHVEAGLRSFDRSMPEEINRLVTDQLSDLLFVTEESALQNLRDEGVPSSKIHFAGNTMIDSLLGSQEKAESSTILTRLGLRGAASGGAVGPYALLTLHRPSNVDDRRTMLDIMEGLEELALSQPIIFPVHPRTRRRLEEFGVRFHAPIHEAQLQPADVDSQAPRDGILLTEPLGYLDFLRLMKHAAVVVTDSGGVQEETTCLGVPCVTVRNNTERPVTVFKGTNVLAGTKSETIRDAIRRQMARTSRRQILPDKWDGKAASRIVAVLLQAHRPVEKSLTHVSVSA